MQVRLSRICLLTLIALFALSGCASTPKSLSEQDIGIIRTLVLTTVLEDNQMSTIDIAGIRKHEYSKTYGGMMYGALGGALEAIIIEGISRYKIHSMVGGSIDPIKEGISGYDAEAAFAEFVFKGMTENLKELNKLQSVRMLDRASTKDKSGHDGDALLKIEYRYGIGALEEKRPLPAVIANISVLSLPDNRLLMKNLWTAFACERRDYTIDDYARDGGRLYRQCFEEMAERFGRDLVSTFF
jgi:hypothetical protein